MLIGLLVAFLFLGEGHKTFLLNPNLAKNIYTYVKDKSGKEKIDKIIKAVGKDQEEFQKKRKNLTKNWLVSI